MRVESGPIVVPLIAELNRKYARGSEVSVDTVTSGYLWLLELAPRD